MKNRKNQKLPEDLIINSSKLELILDKYQEKLAAKNNWSAPFGVLIALLLALMVSDFKDKFGLKALQWETILEILVIVSIVWLIVELKKTITSKPLNDLIMEIHDNIKNIPEYTAIYFIKTNRDNIPKILVEKNRTWDCFFLPYVHYSPYEELDNQKKEHLTKTIAGFLGVDPTKVVIDHLQGYPLTSEKYSESERINKQYNFEFFAFCISCARNQNLSNEEFSVGGREFIWMTLDELEQDVKTKYKNTDVISHLRKNYNTFFHEIRDSLGE